MEENASGHQRGAAVLIPERHGRRLRQDGEGGGLARAMGGPTGRMCGQVGRLGGEGGGEEDWRLRVHSRDSAVCTPPPVGFAQTSPRREAGSCAPGLRRGLRSWRWTRGAISTPGARPRGTRLKSLNMKKLDRELTFACQELAVTMYLKEQWAWK